MADFIQIINTKAQNNFLQKLYLKTENKDTCGKNKNLCSCWTRGGRSFFRVEVVVSSLEGVVLEQKSHTLAADR